VTALVPARFPFHVAQEIDVLHRSLAAVRRRSQVSWRPPSIAISSPTIKLESSVRRNRAKRATSSARIHTAADGSLHPSLPLSEIRRESPSGSPKATGSFVTKRKRVRETMSACITSSYGDRNREFDRRSCWDCCERVGVEERSLQKPNSTQIHHEFVETKSASTVMNFRTTRLGTPVGAQTDALAIFASPNLPSILPMGAFPVTIIALGQVSRRNLDNMAP
jgi:hypothetical protein